MVSLQTLCEQYNMALYWSGNGFSLPSLNSIETGVPRALRENENDMVRSSMHTQIAQELANDEENGGCHDDVSNSEDVPAAPLAEAEVPQPDDSQQIEGESIAQEPVNDLVSERPTNDEASALERPQKRRRIAEGTLQPDLNIIVQDEIFEVHSTLLILVSPVLAQTLRDRLQKQVRLDGKDKEEFVVFWKILQPLTSIEITYGNVHFLSRWANEYQIERLKTRCEDFMMQNLTVDVSNWIHALDNDLLRWAKQCEESIKANVLEHVDQISSNLHAMSDEMLHKLWPHLCNASGIDEPFRMPDAVGAVRPMFAFVTAAIRKAALASDTFSTN